MVSMTAPHIASVYAVKDAKVRKLLTDPTGGTATYGPFVDVPGVKSVGITGDVTTVVLRGDNGPLDQNSSLSGVSCTLNYARLSLDALAVMLSTTVVDAGTGATATASLPISKGLTFSYFELQAVSVSGGGVGGDVLFSLPKCILSSFPELGLAEEDYQTQTVGIGAIPRDSDGRWIVPTIRATAALITDPV
jgi:hypothetical protein